MRIAKINNTNFQAGNVKFRNINAENLQSLESIKKLAEDNSLDIIITKNQYNQYLPLNDFYMAFIINNKNKSALSCTLTKKNLNAKEASINIYNTVIKALENLNNKINNKKSVL